jgi:glycosyltransferase involved in cell wall biosynthesis
VVHGTNYVAPPSRLPTVISVYDCWFLDHPELASTVVRRAGDVLRRAAGRGAWIHASSTATADRARALLGTDRVATILLGPPDAPAHVAPRRPIGVGDRPFVLALGTVERRKHLAHLVTAFATVADALPELDLVIAGAPGDDQPRVAAAVAALPVALARRVILTGAVDEGAKRWLLDHASALAYVSLDEGFGFPVLEAQAAGIPVVASTAGSLPEVAGSGALLVDPNDPRALATAIESIVLDDAARAGLVSAGRHNLARFDWRRTAEEMIGLYQRAIEEAGR